jgi:hypothetical protein
VYVCLNFLFVFALTFSQESPLPIPHFPPFKYILQGVTHVDDPVASIDLCQTAEDVANKRKSGKKRKAEDSDEEEEGDVGRKKVKQGAVKKNKLVFTYAGWQDDVTEVKMLQWKNPKLVDGRLQKMGKKQKMHSGDRSHTNLRALDALLASGLTYAGLRDDVKRVEEYHVIYPILVEENLAKIRKKLEMHSGDRSHANLRALDALVASGVFTYAGWQDDVKSAEMYHCEFPILVDRKMQAMRKKQEMHSGDRSDANLRALDALVASGVFTYTGWQDDVKSAEMYHCEHPDLDSELQAMRTKQEMHSGDRSDANLRALDALLASGLTYAGWQNDVKEVEGYHVKFPILVDGSLQKMRKKQEMHSGDRSHATLRALDALVASGLTYASWRDDVKGVEEGHVMHASPIFVNEKLEEMSRQQLHQRMSSKKRDLESKKIGATQIMLFAHSCNPSLSFSVFSSLVYSISFAPLLGSTLHI